jgi:hypothetical protein
MATLSMIEITRELAFERTPLREESIMVSFSDQPDT